MTALHIGRNFFAAATRPSPTPFCIRNAPRGSTGTWRTRMCCCATDRTRRPRRDLPAAGPELPPADCTKLARPDTRRAAKTCRHKTHVTIARNIRIEILEPAKEPNEMNKEPQTTAATKDRLDTSDRYQLASAVAAGVVGWVVFMFLAYRDGWPMSWEWPWLVSSFVVTIVGLWFITWRSMRKEARSMREEASEDASAPVAEPASETHRGSTDGDR